MPHSSDRIVREFLDETSGAYLLGTVSPVNDDDVTLCISDGYHTVTLDAKDPAKLVRLQRGIERLQEAASSMHMS